MCELSIVTDDVRSSTINIVFKVSTWSQKSYLGWDVDLRKMNCKHL